MSNQPGEQVLNNFLKIVTLAALLLSTARAADVDGAWGLSVVAAEGSAFVSMTVSVDGESARGTTSDSELTGTYKDGKLELDGELFLEEAGYSADANLTARIADDGKLKGKIYWGGYNADVVGSRED